MDYKQTMEKKFHELLKQKKGVAGLNFFLEVIITLFVIGIIVMSLALMGAQLMSSTTNANAISVINTTTQAVTTNATTNFALWITIAGIVVLILMVVLIVRAVREGGLMGGGEGA